MTFYDGIDVKLKNSASRGAFGVIKKAGVIDAIESHTTMPERFIKLSSGVTINRKKELDK